MSFALGVASHTSRAPSPLKYKNQSAAALLAVKRKDLLGCVLQNAMVSSCLAEVLGVPCTVQLLGYLCCDKPFPAECGAPATWKIPWVQGETGTFPNIPEVSTRFPLKPNHTKCYSCETCSFKGGPGPAAFAYS